MQNNIDDELNRLQGWSLADQRKLLEGLEALIHQQESMKSQPGHKAREFRGAGRNAWRGVDVEEYLRQERASWDG